MTGLITLPEIEEARSRLPREVRRTPVVPLARRPDEVGRETLHLKLENLQVTGAYKIRAAFHYLDSLTEEERAKGVVLASSGNFGHGFAYAGRRLGVKVTVVTPERTHRFKVDAIRGHGADLVFCENNFLARAPKVAEVARESGMLPLDTMEDRRVAVGHASIGLEILEDVPDVETVIVPVGSGGLIAGVASAIKLRAPHVRVVGALPAAGAAMYRSVEAGKPVTIEDYKTLADALWVMRTYAFPLAHVQKRVDDLVLVSEEEIAEAVRVLFLRGKVLAEPAGAVPVAAYLAGRLEGAGKTVALVSGGNLNPDLAAGLLAV
ncbi:MAG: threonine/serine dehydratase [Longimicrobiales bacterium]|nr:threonine/serine dehydratase [Longimicrobiales bacterium]